MKPTRLLFRPLAEAQIVEAFNFYHLKSAVSARNWMREVDDAFTAIEYFPRSYAILFDEVRRVKIKDFPYLLLYTVTENDNGREATVVACVHERSNPQLWRLID